MGARVGVKLLIIPLQPREREPLEGGTRARVATNYPPSGGRGQQPKHSGREGGETDSYRLNLGWGKGFSLMVSEQVYPQLFPREELRTLSSVMGGAPLSLDYFVAP